MWTLAVQKLYFAVPVYVSPCSVPSVCLDDSVWENLEQAEADDEDDETVIARAASKAFEKLLARAGGTPALRSSLRSTQCARAS